MSVRLRWACKLLVAVLAFSVCFVAVHLRQVHNRAYEYRWSPSPAAAKVQYAGRDYIRAREVGAVPRSEVLLGRTEGGGLIYGPNTANPYAPTVVHIRADRGKVFDYALSGGP